MGKVGKCRDVFFLIGEVGVNWFVVSFWLFFHSLLVYWFKRYALYFLVGLIYGKMDSSWTLLNRICLQILSVGAMEREKKEVWGRMGVGWHFDRCGKAWVKVKFGIVLIIVSDNTASILIFIFELNTAWKPKLYFVLISV